MIGRLGMTGSSLSRGDKEVGKGLTPEQIQERIAASQARKHSPNEKKLRQAITTAVKARMIDNKNVDASAISVETLNGTVMLSGFAKSASEKTVAESVTWKVNGVKSVKNEIAVRP